MTKTSKEGVQTKMTPLIIEESKKIKGREFEFILNTLRHLKENYAKSTDMSVSKKTRRVDEIINSRKIMGCTEHAHLFIALCRAKDIPCVYVETLEKEWLINKEGKDIKGHVFVKIRLNELDLLIDPSRGLIKMGCSFNQYIPIAEGVDYGSIFPTNKEFLEFAKNLKKKEINKVY